MNTADKIVAFQSYYDPMLAHIVRTRLEANGISCFIADDKILQAIPYYNLLLGGVKIKVFEKDLKKCGELLEEDFSIQRQDDKDIEVIDSVVCPYCTSTNGRYGGATEFKFHWLSLLVSLFFGVPLYLRKAWHCFNCHREGA